jgi:hypothetical protein
LGLYSREQGIKFVTFNISSLYSIPQLYTRDANKPEMGGTVERLLMALIDLRLEQVAEVDDKDAKLKKLQHFRDAKWDKVVNMMMNVFDVNNLGGIHMVRKQNHLHKFFQEVLDDRLQSRMGHGILSSKHDRKCSCNAHHPFSGFSFPCPCKCRDHEECVLLCFLGAANCGPLPAQTGPPQSPFFQSQSHQLESIQKW